MKKHFAALLVTITLTGCSSPDYRRPESTRNAPSCIQTSRIIPIPLTELKHGELIAHTKRAIKAGYPEVMILNRIGADERRRAAVRKLPPKSGYDRDEYPPAAGRAVNDASVEYVISGQNRSAGAVFGNEMRGYCNGTRFTYKVINEDTK